VLIELNGERREVPAETTVAELVDASTEQTRGVAVARGGAVVPRSEWTRTCVVEGDRIEILQAVQGG
jgi:sulfur carrier protein